MGHRRQGSMTRKLWQAVKETIAKVESHEIKLNKSVVSGGVLYLSCSLGGYHAFDPKAKTVWRTHLPDKSQLSLESTMTLSELPPGGAPEIVDLLETLLRSH